MSGANAVEDINNKLGEAYKVLSGAGMTLVKCNGNDVGFSVKSDITSESVHNSTKALGI